MTPLVHYEIPSWVSIAFLICIPLPFVLILNMIRKGAQSINQVKVFTFVLAFFVLYLFYVYLASALGWFNQVFFPPKVLLFTTFPYALLLFMVVVNLNVFKQLVEAITLADLVKLHLFRVIGVFFLILAYYDALPKTFAIIAGLGDFITAIASIFVAKAIVSKKLYAKKLTYIWNVFGAVDILFTAIAANVLTKISIDTGSMGVDTLARFPFCIIPAFAPPTILFLHVLISKKLQAFSE